jgi:hypothetical protein
VGQQGGENGCGGGDFNGISEGSEYIMNEKGLQNSGRVNLTRPNVADEMVICGSSCRD